MGRGKVRALNLALDWDWSMLTYWLMLAETEMTGGIATEKRMRARQEVMAVVEASTTT